MWLSEQNSTAVDGCQVWDPKWMDLPMHRCTQMIIDVLPDELKSLIDALINRRYISNYKRLSPPTMPYAPRCKCPLQQDKELNLIENQFIIYLHQLVHKEP